MAQCEKRNYLKIVPLYELHFFILLIENAVCCLGRTRTLTKGARNLRATITPQGNEMSSSLRHCKITISFLNNKIYLHFFCLSLYIQMKKGVRLLLFMLIPVLLGAGGCSSYKQSLKRNHTKSEQQIQKEKDEKIEKEVERHLHGDVKRIIEIAFEWEGTPYEYGHQEKGISTDCSGMVMKVFEEAIDCKLPRNSAKQAEYCEHVSKSHMKPGDLVFFITNGGEKINHVGIMLDETQFIHASSKGVRVSSLESDYYKKHFIRFGRVPCLRH